MRVVVYRRASGVDDTAKPLGTTQEAVFPSAFLAFIVEGQSKVGHFKCGKHFHCNFLAI